MQRFSEDSPVIPTLRRWFKRYLIVLGLFVVWVVTYAALPQWRSEISAVGLILGVIFYVAAIPISLFSARDAVALQGADTVGGLLVLLALVFVNFMLIAGLEIFLTKFRESDKK